MKIYIKKITDKLNNMKKEIDNKIQSLRIIGGFKDTRTSGEDFAITPYLFGVYVNSGVIKVIGIGICWGYYSFFLALGCNIPKNYPSFKVLK